jgi:hypothetical protein
VGRFSIGRAVTDTAAPCRHQIERVEKRFYHNVEPIRAYAVAGLLDSPLSRAAQQSLSPTSAIGPNSPACFACCSRWMELYGILGDGIEVAREAEAAA